MPVLNVDYEKLPQQVKDNLDEQQWEKARQAVVMSGDLIPETTQYINVMNGQIRTYELGQTADGHLLPTHDLAGARGQDDSQFESSPRGAHGRP